ncbi:hypothetical protein GQ457_18G014010 [Hibiscus cannabinus]
MKILTLKPHLPISRASSSPCLLLTRRFCHTRRPVGFNSKGNDDGVPGTGRPLRDQRPSFPEIKGTIFDPNGSSFHLASDPEKKSQDSQSDVNKQSEAINSKEHEEKVSPPRDLSEDELIQLFKLLSETETPSTGGSVTYAAVVDGSFKPIKLEDSLRILRDMRSKGVVLDAFHFDVAIRGMCEVNHMDDAIAHCLEMLDSGHSPNVLTFVCLVEGLCKEKGVEEAESFIASLKQKGFLVDDEGVRQLLDKKGPFSPLVWEESILENIPTPVFSIMLSCFEICKSLFSWFHLQYGRFLEFYE